MANWAQQEYGADPNKYAQHHSKLWTRDRLWMLKDYLTDEPKQILDELVEELETPEHPEFTRWYTRISQVQDVSAIADEELPKDFKFTIEDVTDDIAQGYVDEMMDALFDTAGERMADRHIDIIDKAIKAVAKGKK